MAKKYNLGSKSDMRKFQRDLEKAVNKSVVDSVRSKGITIECPNCKKQLTARTGQNVCPYCGKSIQLNVDFQ